MQSLRAAKLFAAAHSENFYLWQLSQLTMKNHSFLQGRDIQINWHFWCVIESNCYLYSRLCVSDVNLAWFFNYPGQISVLLGTAASQSLSQQQQ